MDPLFHCRRKQFFQRESWLRDEKEKEEEREFEKLAACRDFVERIVVIVGRRSWWCRVATFSSTSKVFRAVLLLQARRPVGVER